MRLQLAFKAPYSAQLLEASMAAWEPDLSKLANLAIPVTSCAWQGTWLLLALQAVRALVGSMEMPKGSDGIPYRVADKDRSGWLTHQT